MRGFKPYLWCAPAPDPAGEGGGGGGAADANAPVPEPTIEGAETDKKFPWLKTRLDRAKDTAVKGVLKELGVDSLDVAKARITAAASAENSNKTIEQQLKEKTEEASRLKAENDRHATATKTQIDSLTKGFSDEQKALIPSLPEAEKLTWLQNAVARGIFGTPNKGEGSGDPSKQPQGGDVKFTAIPDTAPGIVDKGGTKFISRKWIKGLKPAEFAKFEKDIDAAMKAGRLVE